MMRPLLTSNFFTSIVHRLFIWHVPLSVNLWRHDKQCDNSGSTRRTKLIETAKYSVLNAEFRYESVYDAPFIDE